MYRLEKKSVVATKNVFKHLTPDDEENIDDDKKEHIKPKEFTIGDVINDAIKRAKNPKESSQRRKKSNSRDEVDATR